MIVICGRTCSGKDTFGKALEKDFGFKRNISYTTRPQRLGEVDGEDYYFLTDERFDELEKDGFFAETTKYSQENGDIWKYGTAYAMYAFCQESERCYTILNPEGIKQLIEQDLDFQIIFLCLSDETILRERYILRGETEEKFETRIQQDRKDFYGFNSNTDYIKKWLMSNEKKRVFSIFRLYSLPGVKSALKKWGYIDKDKNMEGYGKRTRADMWEEIQKLKEDYEKEKEKVRSLETIIAQREHEIDCLKKELAAKVKDLNYELSQKNKDGKVIFSDLRRLFDKNTIDVINFYDKDDTTYIFSISEFGYSKYLTTRSKIEIDNFEVLRIRPYFTNDKVNLDVVLDIEEDK